MYVDAILEKKTDTIHVVERKNGQRHLRDIPAPYVFYYEENGGSHRSIYGHKCKRFSDNNNHKFRAELHSQRNAGHRIFESDINPIFRALADTYRGVEAPTLHLGFFDIEVGFDKQRGHAPPDNPFNPVTAITLYRSADQKLLSFVLRPPTFDQARAESAIAEFSDTVLFDDETALLLAFLDAIEDVDVLTTWNGAAYDIPYLVNRIQQTINIATTKRFCLWNQKPAPRQYKNKFGMLVDTFDLVGRVHIDYLDLYAKHVQQQRLSYKLDSIADIEIGETKVVYEGTLDDLYLKDFEKFVKYNRQDVMLMVNIDRKLKFIELANQIAHANYVLLKTTMGSVTLVETAIINEMHDMGYVVPDRPTRDENVVDDDIHSPDEEDDEEPTGVLHADGHTPVVGAYVAQPKKGLQDHIGCVDINSLYPSAIRALNMSPETLIGQVQLTETMDLIHARTGKLPRNKWAEAWDGLFCAVEVQHMLDQNSALMKVDLFDHLQDTVTTQEMTGKQLHAYVFDPVNRLCISANGTIFSTATEGMIPKLLAKWYSERKLLQAKQHECEEMVAGIEIDEELAKLLSE